MKNFRFILLLVTVFSFSIAQFFNIEIFGVKPNLALAAIIASFFFIKDWWEAIFLAGVSAFVLKFSFQPSKEIAIFFVLAIMLAFLARFLPWNSLINCFVLIIIGTAIFYLCVSGLNLIFSELFFKELVYNLIIGNGLFYFYKLLGIDVEISLACFDSVRQGSTRKLR